MYFNPNGTTLNAGDFYQYFAGMCSTFLQTILSHACLPCSEPMQAMLELDAANKIHCA